MATEAKLIAMLGEPEARVRYEACELLRIAPTISPEARLALENALHDPDAAVAERAEAALRVHGAATPPSQPARVTAQAARPAMAGNRVLRAAMIIGLLLVPCVLCGPTFLLMLNGCRDIIPYSRPVEIRPLLELEIPATMDLSHWWLVSRLAEDPEIDSPEYRANSISVERFSSVEEASSEFEWNVNEAVVGPCPAHSAYGGGGTNRYCISPIETSRAPMDGFCAASDWYTSSVLIQRDDVLISIRVSSSRRDSAAMDAAVALLAQELRQGMNPSFSPCDIEVAPNVHYGFGGGRRSADTVYCLRIPQDFAEIRVRVEVDMTSGVVAWALTDPEGTARWNDEVAGEHFTVDEGGSSGQYGAIPGTWQLEVVTSAVAGHYGLIWTDVP